MPPRSPGWGRPPRARSPATGSTPSATSQTPRSPHSSGSWASPPAARHTTGPTAPTTAPSSPLPPPRTITRTCRFDRDELDPEQHHRTVLGLAEQLGSQLRDTDAVCQALTLTVTYADRTSTSRTRTLAEPTAHTPDLADTGRELLTGLGLQRARVQAISLRAERLQPAERAPRQLALDSRDDNARSLEAALDRARTRFGTGIAGSAAAYRPR
ncbi:hypothetical protein OG379_41065 (plasmid) [Streptomyces sp. NBC_01166]|uniref:DinB/UmuC family translesion DNA polymerase n=1 Tax=Streptomyces sp. NBC_01166 TaxID=2903755 RepID=UPI00386FEB66|nr:hypothetical protein OG379_41065 [Streptomyces sp. NBC_01166]